MSGTEHILSVEQAARMIYNTSAPSSEQIRKVQDKLSRGSLVASGKGDTTTTAAVAEYLARQAASQNQSKQRGAKPRQGEPQPGLYKELLKDYFLAILLQRTARKRSQAFGYAVMAFQAALILVPLVVFYFNYQFAKTAFLKSAEQVAIESYLRANYDEFQIERLSPQNESSRVRAKFWYAKKGSKRIESERIFTLEHGQVVQVDMPD